MSAPRGHRLHEELGWGADMCVDAIEVHRNILAAAPQFVEVAMATSRLDRACVAVQRWQRVRPLTRRCSEGPHHGMPPACVNTLVVGHGGSVSAQSSRVLSDPAWRGAVHVFRPTLESNCCDGLHGGPIGALQPTQGLVARGDSWVEDGSPSMHSGRALGHTRLTKVVDVGRRLHNKDCRLYTCSPKPKL